MKRKLTEYSQRYVTALREQLKHGPQASLKPASVLGLEAVALGLETLGLARIHEQALAELGLSDAKNAFTRLAGMFFAEANSLIEETHRAALQTQAHLSKVMAALGRRTEELAVCNRQLRQGADRRKIMEDDFSRGGKLHRKSLEESLELQKRLRHLTHQVMEAQENERKKIGRELQDEIAQTLLGINVRLLALKLEARSNSRGLKKEIASTQRLLVKSARSVRQVCRKIGSP